jgi:hypothetical protein
LQLMKSASGSQQVGKIAIRMRNSATAAVPHSRE